MKFRSDCNGLKLLNNGTELFCDFKAYIMTEQNERTYLDFVCADETVAEFALEEAGARLKLEPVFAGYGAVGATKSGCGEVLSAAEMYPYCYNG